MKKNFSVKVLFFKRNTFVVNQNIFKKKYFHSGFFHYKNISSFI